MPKPQSKNELLRLSQENFSNLLTLVASYSPEDRIKEFNDDRMNRNIRDVLAHLHHWHLLFLKWYDVGMKGEKPKMPEEGFTWKTVPELNLVIWKKYQTTNLETILSLLSASFDDIQKIIEEHSDEVLFEKKRFKWTGSTSLGAYLISNTSSHYDWAIKRIKQSLK